MASEYPSLASSLHAISTIGVISALRAQVSHLRKSYRPQWAWTPAGILGRHAELRIATGEFQSLNRPFNQLKQTRSISPVCSDYFHFSTHSRHILNTSVKCQNMANLLGYFEK